MGTDDNGFMLVRIPYSLKLKKNATTFFEHYGLDNVYT